MLSVLEVIDDVMWCDVMWCDGGSNVLLDDIIQGSKKEGREHETGSFILQPPPSDNFTSLHFANSKQGTKHIILTIIWLISLLMRLDIISMLYQYQSSKASINQLCWMLRCCVVVFFCLRFAVVSSVIICLDENTSLSSFTLFSFYLFLSSCWRCVGYDGK